MIYGCLKPSENYGCNTLVHFMKMTDRGKCGDDITDVHSTLPEMLVSVFCL